MLNIISVRDVVEAILLAVFGDRQGIYNIPGADTLPLSRLVRLCRRIRFPAPGPLLKPLYAARAIATGTDFRYDQNYFHMHFGGVLDGSRAREELGFVPRHRVSVESLHCR
jgi:nucleoside-diphosphate-sugar epimerase